MSEEPTLEHVVILLGKATKDLAEAVEAFRAYFKKWTDTKAKKEDGERTG